MRLLFPKNSSLGNLITSKLKQESIDLSIHSFADTESLVQINTNQIKEEIIYLLWEFSFEKNNPINNQIFNLLLSANKLKSMGVKNIVGVLPYLPYSRQDQETLNLIGNLFKSSGINNIISIDLHDPSIKKDFPIKIQEIEISQFWANHLKNFKTNLCIVSPDKGRIKLNEQVANLLKVDFAYITKKRPKHDHAVALNLYGNVKNKNIVIIDDILDTAKTACSACKLLLENGAKSVVGCFTHPILASDAIKRINETEFEKIFVTNTIPTKSKLLNENKTFTVLDIKELLMNKL